MNRTAVEDIKARLPIEEVIGQYVKLEKAGKSLKAKCPFHNEKSPSFFVSPERGGYYCFGCGAKGDIFTFVEQFEGLDFKGALKLLAEKAGVLLVFDQKADGERDRLFQIMEEAAAFFEAQFDKSKEAREYVKSRGISDQTRKEFRIGWALEGWQNLLVYLRGKKYPDALIEKAGLGKKTEDGKFYDRFRGRVMFPISDSGGRIIAFSGRILKPDEKSAKYLNSPDTPLYDKSLVLYGLDKAKNDIRRMGYSILVEGQMDLVMSHQAGIKNTVAASGTALTDEAVNESGAISNLGLVRRLSPNIIIAFDSDAPGRKAALRAAGIALSMNMDVKIADLVGGKDPADLVKEDVNKWKDALRHAKPVIEFELDNVVREVADHRKLAKAVQERILPLLARIESSSDQSHFVTMIADKAKIPTDSIWQDVKVVAKRLKESANASPISSSAPAASKTTSEMPKRVDLVERRLFGLLLFMEKEGAPRAAEYREEVRKVADASYDEFTARAKTMESDLLFEAEAFYGNEAKNWDRHMKELLINFEEDLINDRLMVTMQELRTAEKEGKSELVAELAKKCQVLSMRKAEVGKRRK